MIVLMHRDICSKINILCLVRLRVLLKPLDSAKIVSILNLTFMTCNSQVKNNLKAL